MSVGAKGLKRLENGLRISLNCSLGIFLLLDDGDNLKDELGSIGVDLLDAWPR